MRLSLVHLLAVGFLLTGILAVDRLAAEPISGQAGAAGAAAEPEIKEVTEAVAAFQKRDFDKTLELLEAAVKAHRDLPPAQVIMAQLYSQVSQPQPLRAALEKAVTGNPDDPEAFIILGDFALRERRYTEASLLYERADSLLKKFEKSAKRKGILQPRAFSGLAAVSEAREDWPAAQKYLDAWLKLDAKNSTAMQRLARTLFQQKKASESLQMLKDAAKADPQVLNPEAQLARFYELYGDPTNAKKWMKYALQKEPKDLRTRLVAAQWALETDQLETAQEHASAAMQIDPKSLDAKILRGVISLFQKDYKGAELYFESAHLQSPGNFAATNNLALALVEQPDENKKRRALEYAEANARQFPRVAEAGSTYGWVLYRLGKIDEAEQVLAKVAGSGSLSPDTAYYIARISVDRNRKDDAKQLLQQALKTTAPFAQRQEAQALLTKLTSASSSGASGSGAGGSESGASGAGAKKGK